MRKNGASSKKGTDMTMKNLVLPTPEQVEWSDCEIGVLIHLDMPTFRAPYNFREHFGDPIPASEFTPMQLDTDQWVLAAKSLGAKYAVLVSKHCSGFCLWPTDVHPYSVKGSPYKDGKGDIVGEFIASCRKYGIRPGLYYSVACNQYMNVDDPGTVRDGSSESQKKYNEIVMAQLNEIWTRYGDLFEIWFDGGVLPIEKGGPDVVPLLHRLQPNAVVFQGPVGTRSTIRWSGNEKGYAAENCSSLVMPHVQLDNGVTERDDNGDSDGTLWCPAECDTPNRDSKRSYGAGWLWREGEEDAVFPAEYLLDVYTKSVGRNGNMLVGMVIDTDGSFPKRDTEEFARFGEMKRAIFDAPIAVSNGETEVSLPVDAVSQGVKVKYASVAEDIRFGERVTGFVFRTFDKDGNEIFKYEGTCIGHKRIFEVPEGTTRAEVEITASKAEPKIRYTALYRGI